MSHAQRPVNQAARFSQGIPHRRHLARWQKTDAYRFKIR